MRYAILSDVHANLEALTAVMEFLKTQRIDHYLCLGDLVGYGADPAACLSRLAACQAVMVGGNHDLACIGKFPLDWFHDMAKVAILWTRDRLSFTDLDALRRLPLTAIIGPFTLVHGTLAHPGRFDYLVEMGQALETSARCRTLMCLVGHTHLPMVIECDRKQRRVLRVVTSNRELSEVSYTDDPSETCYIVNPGSVGQPRDGDPRASCAVIDTDRKHITVHRVSYDVASAQRKICEAGLPSFLADRLAAGR